MRQLRRQIVFGFVLGLTVLSSLGLEHHAWAMDQFLRMDARVGESSVTPYRRTVTGKVTYQPRYTRVPSDICNDAKCPQSQLYWSLVIQTDHAQYLLNEKLNVGEPEAPRLMDLAGVEVHPGSVIQLEGDMIDYGSDLFSIQRVHRVEMVMDLGWACYNMGGGNSNIYARVWHDPKPVGVTEGKDAFKMRVQEVVNRTVKPIALIQEANLAVRSNQFVFSGQSISPKNVEVELEIAEPGPSVLTSAARLKIKKKDATVLAEGATSDVSVIEMNCSRTRTELSLD